jgi:hypothetical protein
LLTDTARHSLSNIMTPERREPPARPLPVPPKSALRTGARRTKGKVAFNDVFVFFDAAKNGELELVCTSRQRSHAARRIHGLTRTLCAAAPSVTRLH